jgi:hypothetical protein
MHATLSKQIHPALGHAARQSSIGQRRHGEQLDELRRKRFDESSELLIHEVY